MFAVTILQKNFQIYNKRNERANRFTKESEKKRKAKS